MQKSIVRKLALTAAFSMVLSVMTACGEQASSSNADTKAASTSLQDETEKHTAENTAVAAGNNTQASEVEYALDFELAPGLSEKYVDFDNRAFVYNGKLFQLSVNTIGDLMDAGLTFDNNEFEMPYLEAELTPNEESLRYTSDVSNAVRVTVQGKNLTEDMLIQKDSVLTYFEFALKDTPRAGTSDEMLATILSGVKEANNLFKFSFPLDLKQSALLEKCPDTTENDGKGGLRYLRGTDNYSWNGYIFRFEQSTDVLSFFSISWLPD